MKILLLLILTLSTLAGLSGCNSGEVSSQDAQNFGKESEADRAAKADGTYNEGRSDR